mmetsp:Transcript_29098/g.89974  ORF Transcript_29098/g.89974 Transcript_29098/m.89974 type:complete len:306 (+) Transcript_29098:331-1248(+)
MMPATCSKPVAKGNAAKATPAVASPAGMRFAGPTRSASFATGSVATRDTAAWIAKRLPTAPGLRPRSPVRTRGSTVIFTPAIVAKNAKFARPRRRISGDASHDVRSSSTTSRAVCDCGGAAASPISRLPRVSASMERAATALRARTPPTKTHVYSGPTACASAPPSAGPKIMPPLKPAITGAIVDARDSGVEMSAAIILIAVTSPVTPTPESARDAARPAVPPAAASEAKPPPSRTRPPTRSGCRPFDSTRPAAGTFAKSFVSPNADTAKPNSAGPMPRSWTMTGKIGTTVPTDRPAENMAPASG